MVGGSPFYAPVGCDMIVETSTSVGIDRRLEPNITARNGMLVITTESAGAFECFSPDGRLIKSGGLREGMNAIGVIGITGVALVRVRDGQRAINRRVWLE